MMLSETTSGADVSNIINWEKDKLKKYTYEEALKLSLEYFNGDDLAAKVFVDKYALRDGDNNLLEVTPDQMHDRLAGEFARIESKYENPMSKEEIFGLFDRFKYVIGQGSPMSGIGNPYFVQSLGNCFVINPPVDSYGGILKADQELVQLSKRRAGVGISLSNIRPKGMPTKNAAKTTDGIAVFMERFSNSCREVAQCLHGDTLILTISGLKKISEIKPGEEVWTNAGWVGVEKVLKNKKQLLKLTTKFGKEIIASKDHVFHTINGEKRLEEFQEGDEITQIVGNGWQGSSIKFDDFEYVKRGNNKSNRLNNRIKLPKVLDEKCAYVLGQMYGDGCVEHNGKGVDSDISVSLSDKWTIVSEKYCNYIKDVFGYDLIVNDETGGKYSVAHMFSTEVIEFLRANKLLKQKAAKIEFPARLFNAPSSVIFAFISGYFDADGCVQVSKKQYKMNSICKNFLLDIQSVLAAHGVISKIHVENRSEQGWNDLYALTINGSKSQETFYNLMSECVKVSSSKRFSKKRDFTNTIYHYPEFINKRPKYVIDSEQFLTYSTFYRMKKDNFINKSIECYLLQDNIKSIVEFGDNKMHDVYDLVLPREHLFFANGLYVHNSGRRGALMETISVEHPEVETFITIKQDKKKVTGANVSVQITDEFMKAVKQKKKFTLRFPVGSKTPAYKQEIDALELWNKLIHCAWSSAEPGVLFWDTIINNSPADIYGVKDSSFISTATNPCGEVPLGIDSCRLLVVNLLSFVENQFLPGAKFNFNLFGEVVIKAQRLMDDLVDLELEQMDKIIDKIKSDPESDEVKAIELNMWKEFKRTCTAGRRTGLGITGLGDCLAALGVKYGSEESIKKTEKIYKALAINAHKSSAIMAKERGAFPLFEHKLEKDHKFINRIVNSDDELLKLYNKHGRRNIAITTTAPTGSVSTLTQTTSGIEPTFLLSYTRRKKINPTDQSGKVDFIDAMGDKWQEFTVYHHGIKKWMDATGETDIKKSPYWQATSNEIDWVASIDIQAAAGKWVCHSISKTANVPKDTSEELISEMYMRAWESGCKGFTVYRDGCRDGVLLAITDKKDKEGRPTIIIHADAPKRPTELPCELYTATVKGQKWTVLIGLLDEKPYEIFTGLSENLQLPAKCTQGKIVKVNKGHYNLHVDVNGEDLIIKDIIKVFDNPESAWATRMLSLSLRHGVSVDFVVDQLGRDGAMGDYNKVISRILKKFIKDGAKVRTSAKCPSCSSTDLTYQEGCVSCTCGYSKCN